MSTSRLAYEVRPRANRAWPDPILAAVPPAGAGVLGAGLGVWLGLLLHEFLPLAAVGAVAGVITGLLLAVLLELRRLSYSVGTFGMLLASLSRSDTEARSGHLRRIEYYANDAPARAVELPDGAVVHAEADEESTAITWSTETTAGEFIRRAIEELNLGRNARGWAVDSQDGVHQDLDLIETLDRADRATSNLVGLYDPTHERGATWHLSPARRSRFPEAGAAGRELDRRTVERLLLETCTWSIHAAAHDILEIVDEVAANSLEAERGKADALK